MPALSEETEEILDCFLLCQKQLRAGYGGAYALDWGVIKGVAESLGIPTSGQFYRLLAAYEKVLIAEMNKT